MQPNPRYAHHILPHIIYIGLAERLGYLFGRHDGVYADWLADIGLDGYTLSRCRYNPDFVPMGVIALRCAYVSYFAPGIIVFAFIESIGYYRACGRTQPGFVGDDILPCAVFILYLQFGQQARILSVVSIPAWIAIAHALPPSVTQYGTECIVTLTKQRCHIISVVHQTMIIIGPSRIIEVLTYLFAIGHQLIYASGSSIETSLLDRFGQTEGLAQIWGCHIACRYVRLYTIRSVECIQTVVCPK